MVTTKRSKAINPSISFTHSTTVKVHQVLVELIHPIMLKLRPSEPNSFDIL